MKITLGSIKISDKLNDFSQYLETTDRIILSAKFGDGKTYLLNELRKDEAIQDKYEFFTIYPVTILLQRMRTFLNILKEILLYNCMKESCLRILI